MGTELDAVARTVQTALTSAQAAIRFGLLCIDLFKATLTGEERLYADRLQEEVRLKFQNLEASIDEARDDLLQTLADQYSEHVNQLETTFREIDDELKKSWIDRAVDFIVTVGKTVFQLAELLFSILVRVYHLVWDIIRHPIRFFETLVSGLRQGIGDFVGNLGTHLQEAFWTWVTGATPVQDLRLSASSGVASLFDLVTRVLALGPAELRVIVERVLGKGVLELLDRGTAFGERALEPVTILLTRGPAAFWDHVRDTLGSIIESAFDRIRESVFYAFVEKGLKWIAGFFVPGGGFVKIVKAILRAFQFVAENLDRIRHFFDAVFESMADALQGSPGGVAGKIVAGLKIGVVLALDFLARQLGLGRITDGVQKIIHSLRRPIVNAIEWVLRAVKPVVTRLMRAVGIRPDDEPRDEELPVAAQGPYDGQIGKVVPFSAAGESHRLWIAQQRTNAVVMMSSDGKPVAEQLDDYEQMAADLADAYVQQNALRHIRRARQMLAALDAQADGLARSILSRHAAQEIGREDEVVEGAEERLAARLVEIRETLGLPGPAPEAGEAGDVRDRAARALATVLSTDHTWPETVALVRTVADRLQPEGLRGLDAVPGSTGNDAVVYAETATRSPVARLEAQEAAPAPEPETAEPGGRTVTARTRLTLSRPVAVTPGAFAPAGGVPRVPTGGEVLPQREEDRGTVVDVRTWNTSNIDAKGNDSDAEHQFVSWLRRPANEHLLPLIAQIEIAVHTYIPCSWCANELARLLDTIKGVQGRDRTITRAALSWSTFYRVGTRPVSWQNLRDLQSSGWSLSAPRTAFPPEQTPTTERLPAGAHLWHLAGRSLAPPAPGRLQPGEREAGAEGVKRRRRR
jgi:hypothetical protein